MSSTLSSTIGRKVRYRDAVAALEARRARACRWRLLRVVDGKVFLVALSVVVVFAMVIASIKLFEVESAALDWMDFAITVIFTVEVVLRLIAMRSQYLLDKLCALDLLVTIIDWVTLLLNVVDADAVAFARLFRVARLTKVSRLARLQESVIREDDGAFELDAMGRIRSYNPDRLFSVGFCLDMLGTTLIIPEIWVQYIFLVLLTTIWGVNICPEQCNSSSNRFDPNAECGKCVVGFGIDTGLVFHILVFFIMGLFAKMTFQRMWTVQQLAGRLSEEISAGATLAMCYMSRTRHFLSYWYRKDIVRLMNLAHMLYYKRLHFDRNYTDLVRDGLLTDFEWDYLEGRQQHAEIVYQWTIQLINQAVRYECVRIPESLGPKMQYSVIRQRQLVQKIDMYLTTQIPYAFIHLMTLIVKFHLLFVSAVAGSFVGKGIHNSEGLDIAWGYVLILVTNMVLEGMLRIHSVLYYPFFDNPNCVSPAQYVEEAMHISSQILDDGFEPQPHTHFTELHGNKEHPFLPEVNQPVFLPAQFQTREKGLDTVVVPQSMREMIVVHERRLWKKRAQAGLSTASMMPMIQGAFLSRGAASNALFQGLSLSQLRERHGRLPPASVGARPHPLYWESRRKLEVIDDIYSFLKAKKNYGLPHGLVVKAEDESMPEPEKPTLRAGKLGGKRRHVHPYRHLTQGNDTCSIQWDQLTPWTSFRVQLHKALVLARTLGVPLYDPVTKLIARFVAGAVCQISNRACGRAAEREDVPTEEVTLKLHRLEVRFTVPDRHSRQRVFRKAVYDLWPAIAFLDRSCETKMAMSSEGRQMGRTSRAPSNAHRRIVSSDEKQTTAPVGGVGVRRRKFGTGPRSADSKPARRAKVARFKRSATRSSIQADAEESTAVNASRDLLRLRHIMVSGDFIRRLAQQLKEKSAFITPLRRERRLNTSRNESPNPRIRKIQRATPRSGGTFTFEIAPSRSGRFLNTPQSSRVVHSDGKPERGRNMRGKHKQRGKPSTSDTETQDTPSPTPPPPSAEAASPAETEGVCAAETEQSVGPSSPSPAPATPSASQSAMRPTEQSVSQTAQGSVPTGDDVACDGMSDVTQQRVEVAPSLVKAADIEPTGTSQGVSGDGTSDNRKSSAASAGSKEDSTTGGNAQSNVECGAHDSDGATPKRRENAVAEAPKSPRDQRSTRHPTSPRDERASDHPMSRRDQHASHGPKSRRDQGSSHHPRSPLPRDTDAARADARIQLDGEEAPMSPCSPNQGSASEERTPVGRSGDKLDPSHSHAVDDRRRSHSSEAEAQDVMHRMNLFIDPNLEVSQKITFLDSDDQKIATITPSGSPDPSSGTPDHQAPPIDTPSSRSLAVPASQASAQRRYTLDQAALSDTFDRWPRARHSRRSARKSQSPEPRRLDSPFNDNSGPSPVRVGSSPVNTGSSPGHQAPGDHYINEGGSDRSHTPRNVLMHRAPSDHVRPKSPSSLSSALWNDSLRPPSVSQQGDSDDGSPFSDASADSRVDADAQQPATVARAHSARGSHSHVRQLPIRQWITAGKQQAQTASGESEPLERQPAAGRHHRVEETELPPAGMRIASARRVASIRSWVAAGRAKAQQQIEMTRGRRDRESVPPSSLAQRPSVVFPERDLRQRASTVDSQERLVSEVRLPVEQWQSVQLPGSFVPARLTATVLPRPAQSRRMRSRSSSEVAPSASRPLSERKVERPWPSRTGARAGEAARNAASTHTRASSTTSMGMSASQSQDRRQRLQSIVRNVFKQKQDRR